MRTRLGRAYVYARGRRWLKRGWCPLCYSSPPRNDCQVCEGEMQYGYRISEETRTRWGLRWMAWKP